MFPLSSVVHYLLPQRTVFNRPATEAEHTLGGEALPPPVLSLIKRNVAESSSTLQMIFNLLLLQLLTFVQHDRKVLLQQAMSIWCDSNKIYRLKTDHYSLVFFFSSSFLLAWVVFATYTVHQEKKKKSS